jgi:signal transduction histidine kinase
MEELMRSGWAQLVHPDDVENVYAKYLTAADARRSFRIECRVRRANGRYRWVLTTGIPISSKGTYAGHIGTCIDITDLKRSHDQLLATEKLESLGVMAAGIAHDFNNLLGGVLAESDLALSELPPDSPARENVEHIYAVATHASEIVDLLMASAGGRDVAFEEVDLSKIVAEMLELLRVSLPGNAALDSRLDDGLPAIRANPSQIRQLILNLVKNSSEALQGEDGTITVTTRTIHLDRSTAAELPADLPEGDYAGLMVCDTGCGMAAEVRTKVFDPFYTTKFTGRGLGLAVVQGIIRSHGGAINVISTPGKGSTFEILLPYAGRKEMRQSMTEKLAVEPVLVLGTVLVVEDEEALRLAVSKALAKSGFRVLAAATGETALELFRAHANTIDLILLDLNLPGVSGAEMFVEVRHIRPDIKVVITTGYDPQSIGAGYLWSGQAPSAFFRKPYRLLELMRSVRELVLPPHAGHGAAA